MGQQKKITTLKLNYFNRERGQECIDLKVNLRNRLLMSQGETIANANHHACAQCERRIEMF
jgi:hypothetical protein